MRGEVTNSVRRDDDGRLTAVTVNWGESIPTLEHLAMACIVWCGLAFLPVGMFSSAWSMITLGIGIGAFFLWRYYPLKEREVTFTAEGRIVTPYGFAYRELDGAIKGNHASITSIESRQMPNSDYKLYEVIVTSAGGSLFPVSVNLDEQTAFQVAVLLTRRLIELREDQADGRSDTTLRGPQGPRDGGWGEARVGLS